MKKDNDEILCSLCRWEYWVTLSISSSCKTFDNYRSMNYPDHARHEFNGVNIKSHAYRLLVTIDARSSTHTNDTEFVYEILDALSMIGLKVRVSDMPGKWRKGSVDEVKDRINQLIKGERWYVR